MVGAPGLEPGTSSLSETRSKPTELCAHTKSLLIYGIGGAGGSRTRDILLAKQAL